jgi:hypothetical protein
LKHALLGYCCARAFLETFLESSWNVAETSADGVRWTRLIERHVTERTSRTAATREDGHLGLRRTVMKCGFPVGVRRWAELPLVRGDRCQRLLGRTQASAWLCHLTGPTPPRASQRVPWHRGSLQPPGCRPVVPLPLCARRGVRGRGSAGGRTGAQPRPEAEILTLLALLDRLCAMLTRLAHMSDRPSGPAQTGQRGR